jgi:hypothetical protein
MRVITVKWDQALKDALVLLNRTPSDTESENLKMLDDLSDEDLDELDVEEYPFDKDEPDGRAECHVEVGGETFCVVPPYEGSTMRDQADAIARAGKTILSLYRAAMRARPAASVMQEWTYDLSRRTQAVLIAAVRGCDGAPKEDPTKPIVRSLRAAIMVPSNLDYDPLKPGAVDMETFMAYHPGVRTSMRQWLDSLDQYPMHFVMHLLHAAEIVGYRHPVHKIAEDYLWLYMTACKNNLHVRPEAESELRERLRDR